MSSSLTKRDRDDDDNNNRPTTTTTNNNNNNPIVFFDVSIGGKPAGRITMELFSDIVPRTAENFFQFCIGGTCDEKTMKPRGYKNTKFHRVVKGFIIQGGDFVKSDGTGIASIYNNNKTFEDENFSVPHTTGCLSMASAGPNSNGCQFFFVTSTDEKVLSSFNKKHVAFGRVVDGAYTLKQMESVPVGLPHGWTPEHTIEITECGE
eukprot:PhM_4_TR18576/c0_g1_i1/m.59956/K09567/PPIH, CYPH; peptidyl-prolyl isomerase H (cyclophilin H)